MSCKLSYEKGLVHIVAKSRTTGYMQSLKEKDKLPSWPRLVIVYRFFHPSIVTCFPLSEIAAVRFNSSTKVLPHQALVYLLMYPANFL